MLTVNLQKRKVFPKPSRPTNVRKGNIPAKLPASSVKLEFSHGTYVHSVDMKF